MEGVSRKVPVRSKIADNEIGDHKALSGLDPDFRVNADWYGPEDPADDEGKVVSMHRLPNDEPNPTEGVRLVFADRANHKAKLEDILPDRMAEFSGLCLNYIRPLSPDFCKAGAAICDALELSVCPNLAAELLCLRQADEAIARAHQAALLGAFASNVATTDLELANVAIASFIHAHPAFANLVDEGKWHRPYGDRTAYWLLRRG
jgi:hypothetical protein